VKLIASRMEVKDEMITGKIDGRNCHGEEKSEGFRKPLIFPGTRKFIVMAIQKVTSRCCRLPPLHFITFPVIIV